MRECIFDRRLRLGVRAEPVYGKVVLRIESGSAARACCCDGLPVAMVDEVAAREYAGQVRLGGRMLDLHVTVGVYAQPISIRITGDAEDGRLLGAYLVGRLGTETAKRVDTYATALFAGLTVQQISDLDLSYTPPIGPPWDAVQAAAQATIETEITA